MTEAGPVSRETAAAGARLFGDRLGLAEAYADLLGSQGVVRGLIGPRELPRLWPRHLLNSALLAELVPAGATVCDIGSGAGLPGIPLAIARPDLAVELVEPMLRRTTFLVEAVARLQLGSVRVTRSRAEGLAGHRAVDAVVVRAVAPLSRLAAWCLPLLRPGGSLLALKGSRAQEELAAAEGDLLRHGAAGWDVVTCGRRDEGRATVLRVLRA